MIEGPPSRAPFCVRNNGINYFYSIQLLFVMIMNTPPPNLMRGVGKCLHNLNGPTSLTISTSDLVNNLKERPR